VQHAGERAIGPPLVSLLEQDVAGEEIAGRLRPAGDEGRLELPHRGAGEADVGVAPLSRVAAVAEPLVVDAEAAGVADRAVDADDADVGAVLDLVQGAQHQRTEGRGVHAGGVERAEVFLRKGGAESVVQEEHPDAGTRPLDEDLVQHVGHASGVAVVHLHRDGLACRAQVVPEPRVGLVAIAEELHPVAGGEWGVAEQLHLDPEGGIVHRGGLASIRCAHGAYRCSLHGTHEPNEDEKSDDKSAEYPGDEGEVHEAGVKQEAWRE
jgi:hypothetical protein